MKPTRPKPVLTYPIKDHQVILDYVYHHFIVEENPRAVNYNGLCVYDTPTGGCAIGCLLPSELRTRLNGVYRSVSALFCEDHRFFRDFNEVFASSVSIEFLAEIQQWHDHSLQGDGADAHIEALAKAFNLTLPDAL